MTIVREETEIERAIEEYADMIRKICFIHMKQECDVDDIFQTVFLKYANGPDFKNREHEKAWLIRVSINACHDMTRLWFHRNVVLCDDLEPYGSEAFPRSEILDCVLQLPEKYRDVIYLYYYEGYKITEIAKLLKRRENTIHTWLRRAKQELKDMLGGDDFA